MRTTEIIHSRNMTITHRYVGMLLRSIPIHTLAPKVRGVGERQEWSPLLNDVSSVEVFWPPHKTMHTLDQKLLFASVVFSLCPPPVARMQRLLPTGLMQPELTQPTKQKMECKTNTPNRNVIWKRNTTKHKYADTHTQHIIESRATEATCIELPARAASPRLLRPATLNRDVFIAVAAHDAVGNPCTKSSSAPPKF